MTVPGNQCRLGPVLFIALTPILRKFLSCKKTQLAHIVTVFIFFLFLFCFVLTTWDCFAAKNVGLNPLSANFTKWSNTLIQFVGKFPTNCLAVFDHFVGLALKGLNTQGLIFKKELRMPEHVACISIEWQPIVTLIS